MLRHLLLPCLAGCALTSAEIFADVREGIEAFTIPPLDCVRVRLGGEESKPASFAVSALLNTSSLEELVRSFSYQAPCGRISILNLYRNVSYTVFLFMSLLGLLCVFAATDRCGAGIAHFSAAPAIWPLPRIFPRQTLNSLCRNHVEGTVCGSPCPRTRGCSPWLLTMTTPNAAKCACQPSENSMKKLSLTSKTLHLSDLRKFSIMCAPKRAGTST